MTKSRCLSLAICLICPTFLFGQSALYYQPHFPPEEFKARWDRIYERVGDRAVVLLQGMPKVNGFILPRQNNEFYYLCGIETPHAYLVLDGKTRKTALYLPPRDFRLESAEGRVISAEDADFVKRLIGVDEVHSSQAMTEEQLPQFKDAATIYTLFTPGEGTAQSRLELRSANNSIKADYWDGRISREDNLVQLLRKRFPKAEVKDLTPILDGLRAVKSPREIALIRRASQLAGLGLIEAMKSTKPGGYEYQLEAAARYVFLVNGARLEGYRSIVAAGTANIWNMHYYRNNCELKDGDLVLMDYAPDYGNYVSDIARMWPVNGKFSPEQRELLQFVLEYRNAILKRVRPGVEVRQVMDEAKKAMEPVFQRTRFSKPIYEKAARTLVERGGGVFSHPVGMAVHDDGNYYGGPLRPGHVFSIDPQLRVPEERIYMRYEDVVVVTDNGVENFTSFLPSELDEIEKLVGQGGIVQQVPPVPEPANRTAAPALPPVTPPPESFFEKVRERDREAARAFYKKYIDVKGMPVVAAAEVADEALQRTYDIVTHLLAGRPDVLETMAKNGTRLIIIGKDQVYTDMPEYRNSPNPQYQNERVRGTGGFGITSFGEENLLNLPLDRYDDESIGVHEFCHTIDAALGRIDPTWRQRLSQTYRHAIDQGLWKNAYTASNPAEYWAEICQSYFDCNRINNWNHAAIGTREQLKQYDPAGYELVQTTFRLTPENDWRYQPLRRQPSVIPPPARFKVDPYYTKFTWAREFTVLGSKHVSDEALLRANDTIRKLFAYRHDILKALIADGARLVVLGRGEKLSDLPEFKEAKGQASFDAVRTLDYTPALKLMVVPEENVLGMSGDPFAGEGTVVGVFARALYRVTGLRPVDPDFERQRNKQQYELRVRRMDVEFDQRLGRLYDEARAKGLWKGTPAARDRAEYWAAGVETYFDAAGAGQPPVGADRPITTREALKAYDPELYALVDETMAYAGHVDWRFRLPRVPVP